MRLSPFVASMVVLVPALASAAPRVIKAPGTAHYGDVVEGPATINDLKFARQVLPPITPEPGTSAVLAQSKTIYLNKNGVTLQPGTNDSRTNRSTLATQATTIPAWTTTAANWTATVTCMKDMFSAYDVTVTDVDPGTAPHVEAVFGGTPTLLGMPNNVAGVSPFTTNCAIIENAIVFTFTSVLPQNDPRLVCEIMAQEVAHAYGLDHELLASDPMTYLDYTGNRAFQNSTATCGEDTVRPCGINGSTCRPNQNSVALLTERLGKKVGQTDTTPPTGGITSPAANATVPPGFQIVTDANDNQMVVSAKLYVDGTLSDTLTAGPFTFTTSASMAEGTHRLEVELTDGANMFTTQEITVTVKKGAQTPGGGSGDAGDDTSEVTGGCSTSGNASGSLLLGLALAGLIRRRR